MWGAAESPAQPGFEGPCQQRKPTRARSSSTHSLLISIPSYRPYVPSPFRREPITRPALPISHRLARFRLLRGLKLIGHGRAAFQAAFNFRLRTSAQNCTSGNERCFRRCLAVRRTTAAYRAIFACSVPFELLKRPLRMLAQEAGRTTRASLDTEPTLEENDSLDCDSCDRVQTGPRGCSAA